jgi:nucleoside-diphosphate-sugar epimerase
MSENKIKFIENINDLHDMKIQKESTLIYLAGYSISDHKYSDIDKMVTTYITDLTKTLDICVKNKSNIIIGGSYWELIETNNNSSINLYAALHKSQKPILKFYAENYNQPIIKLFLSDIYGPEDWRPKLLPTLLKSIENNSKIKMGSPGQIIAPVYIDDVIEIIVQLIEQKIKLHSKYSYSEIQINPVKIYTLVEYVEELEEIMQKKVNALWGVNKKVRADIVQYPKNNDLTLDVFTNLKSGLIEVIKNSNQP